MNASIFRRRLFAAFALGAGLFAFQSTGSGQNAPAAEAEASTGADAAMTEEQQQQEMNAFVESFGWERNSVGELSEWATVAIPEGYRFTQRSGTKQFLELTGNLVGESELGIIAPEEFEWWVLFEFDESGYVKDEDKDELDAEKMLKAMQEGQEAANEYRQEAGLGALYVVGWAQEPNYNTQTNNLEWATILKDENGEENVNYNTRLLGRRGVMSATLICDQEQLASVLPDFQSLLAGFAYKEGQSYAEFQEGDKIAKYGLAALVLGGGAALAAKTGLFAVIAKFFGKFFKVIIIAVVGIGVAIKRLFTGRSEA